MPIKQLGLSWPALGAATVLALLALRRALKRRPRAPAGAIVVVTGCDTGIGNATAKLLSEQTRNGEPEFRVLAGCLTPQGIDELKALGRQNLVPFELDVTSDESVERMRKMVGEECSGKGLFALYNIAGIGLGTTVDLTPMEEQKMVMEVNYFGVVRCTAALLPWIHQAAHFSRLANARGEPTLKPKVITISSVLSVITLPGASAYVASKVSFERLQSFSCCLPDFAARGTRFRQLPPLRAPPVVHRCRRSSALLGGNQHRSHSRKG